LVIEAVAADIEIGIAHLLFEEIASAWFCAYACVSHYGATLI
jgi:hypothetical protein